MGNCEEQLLEKNPVGSWQSAGDLLVSYNTIFSQPVLRSKC